MIKKTGFIRIYWKRTFRMEKLQETAVAFDEIIDEMKNLISDQVSSISAENNIINVLFASLTEKILEANALAIACHKHYSNNDKLLQLLTDYSLKMDTKYYYDETSLFGDLISYLGVLLNKSYDCMDQVNTIFLDDLQRYFGYNETFLSLSKIAAIYRQLSLSSEKRKELENNIEAFCTAIKAMLAIGLEIIKDKNELENNIEASRIAIKSMPAIFLKIIENKENKEDKEDKEDKSDIEVEFEFQFLQQKLDLMEHNPNQAFYRSMELLEANDLLTRETVMQIEKNPEEAIVMAIETGLLDRENPIDADILLLQDYTAGLNNYAEKQQAEMTIPKNIIPMIESFAAETENLMPAVFYSRLHGLFSKTVRDHDAQDLALAKSLETSSCYRKI